MSTSFKIVIAFLLSCLTFFGQTNSPAPYCNGGYTSGNCLQGGPTNNPNNSVNDFIDNFMTIGGNVNISNNGSGCNQGPNNYINYCQHYMQVTPGAVITASVRSGITFAQGFAIFIDWNQDNVFQMPGEQVAATSNVPAAATWTTLTFTVPATIPPGSYRMRVRCAFATAGTAITPCGTFSFGETEDYTIFVGPIPPSAGVVTGTAIGGTVCVGQALTFSFSTTFTTPLTYTWTGPANFSSTAANPVIPNASLTANGIYTVVASNNICPTTKTVSPLIVAYPTFTTSPATHVICQGGSLNSSVINLIGAPTQYSIQWAGPGTIFNPASAFTTFTPPLLSPTVPSTTFNYSITVTPTVLSCPVTQLMPVTVNNPPSPTVGVVGPLCNTSIPLQLTAQPGGGTWSGSPAVSPGGFFTPALAAIPNNTLVYTVAIGSCTNSSNGYIQVSRFHPATITSTISKCALDPPFYLKNIVQDTTTGTWTATSSSVVSANYFFPNQATGTYTLKYHSPSWPNPNVCPDSSYLVVPVFNPPIPVISAISPKCTSAANVTLQASPPGGVWSGNVGVTPLGVQIPSLVPVGQNTVVYTAGQGTCTASNSRTFHVSQYNPATITGIIPQQCVSNAPFNLMSIVQNTTGSWQGTNVGNGVFNPNNLPTGVYTLTYSTVSSPSAGLCDDKKSISVSVLNPPTPSISAVGPFCIKGSALQLTVVPNIGQWIASPYLSSTGIFTPSLSAVGQNIVQYAIGNSTCSSTDSEFINIEDFVPASIVHTLPDLCDNSTMMNLGPLTLNNTGVWSGKGVLGLNFDPTMYGAGTYSLIYSTSSVPSGLCPDADTLTVKVFSLAPPVISPLGPFCDNSLPQQFKVSPVGGIFEGASGSAVSTDGVFNPAYGVIGQNLVSYSITNGPCVAFSQSTVQIQKFISAEILKQPEPAYCENENAFNLNGFVRNPGGTWNGTGVEKNHMFNPSLALPGINTLVYRTFSLPDPLLCPDVSTLAIRIKEMPKVTINGSAQSGCAPFTARFNSPSQVSGSGSWNFGDGSENPTGFDIIHKFTTPGSYDVQFQFFDSEAKGCSTLVKLPFTITVYPSPSADFVASPDEIFISDPMVTLTNTSKDLFDNEYQWTVQGHAPNFDLHPVYRFDAAGTYQVKLEATNLRGCKSEKTKMIEVKNDFNVFIPNSFSPNFDGINDKFKPVFSAYGLDHASFDMQIFDRWGHIVFMTKDPNSGWDGTFQNKGNMELKEDTYNYRIRFRDVHGSSYVRQGTVLLLK